MTGFSLLRCDRLPLMGSSSTASNSLQEGMAMEMVQTGPVLDKFKALVREREDELRGDSDEEDESVGIILSSEEIVKIYEIVLSELIFNAKAIIAELTIIAGEHRVYAGEGIADAICAHIVEVPVEQKLPCLYLLDSIVKNIGCEYVRYFAARLPEVFVEAYRQVQPDQHPAMRHLFGTWSTVFLSSVLRKIGIKLQFSSLGNDHSSSSTSMRSPRPLDNQKRPRPLIDAYGNYRGESIVNGKPSKIGRLDVNGNNSDIRSRKWENTEVEEYVWEDMSPTLGDRDRRSNGLSQSNPFTKVGVGVGVGVGRPTPSITLADYRTGYRPTQSQPHVADDSQIFSKDAVSILGSALCDTSSKCMDGLGNHMTQIQGSKYSRDSWSEKADQMHFPLTGTDMSAGQIVPSLMDSTDVFSTTSPNQSQGLGAPLPPQLPKSMSQGSWNHAYIQQGYGATPYNRVHGYSLSMPMHGIPNTSFQMPGSLNPPLPPGPPPSSSQTPAGGDYVDLMKSLIAQGLLKLETPTAVQDSIGTEFNADILKLESSIKVLYADLPRQCKTCGLRFKCQGEHSIHMDWHVTKNRVSKKSKQKPSRKWFVSTTLWLTTAETLGNDAVPGFSPNESVVERKEDEMMAVPADEEQSACTLCGDPFDSFYCDETEEWMYKGAVYMNAARNGSPPGMDMSQLGPIVHAKCRS